MGAFIAAELGHRWHEYVIGVHLIGALPLDAFTRVEPFGTFDKHWGFERPAGSSAADEPPLPNRIKRRSSHRFAHGLEPQTLGAAMHDSPAGMMAWLMHRRYWWSDIDDDLLQAYSREFLLTTFSLYWFTESIVSSIRWYRDMIFDPWTPAFDGEPVVKAPTGISFFDHDELTGQSRYWADRYFNLVRSSTQPRGGHFAPAEVPDIVVAEIRATFRLLRPAR
jgi:pimeloyl-ACP methyl ester carboxylesterase